MERRGVAKFLTKYLDSNAHINVLNVNAPWGAGKTFFLENWYEELLEKRAVIYFNAWKHDYAGDAFVALTATIHDSLKQFIPTAPVDDALSDFRRKAARAILAATPVVAKGILKKVTGVDISVVVDGAREADDDTLPNAAEKALEELLQSNSKTMQTVDDFKVRFARLAMDASQAQATKFADEPRPLYVFIDELDRCRPTFSIELLERVKHFFDVDNCKFIIACDLEQLRHSIGAVYGYGFSGDRYLKRFFDAEYTLDYGNIEGWVKAQVFKSDLFADIPVQLVALVRNSWRGNHRPVAPSANAVLSGDLQLDKLQVILLAIAKTFGFKLRELEKCLRQVRAIHSAVGSNDFDFFWAMYLVALRDEAPDLYQKVARQNKTEDWKRVFELYPAKELYCGYGNHNIHALAQRYMSYVHGPQGKGTDDMYKRDLPPGIAEYVASRFVNEKYDVSCQYLNYVDLAHAIE